MKAIVKYGSGSGDIDCRDMPAPLPDREKILVQIKSTGICHTDISILNGEYKGRKPVPIPLIPGHEASGIVVESYTGNSLFKPGDRVAFEPLSGCRTCSNCQNGYINLCSDWVHVGITCDGTFAEYIAVPERSLHKLPDNVSFSDAALLEPIGLTARSLENVKPALGDVAAVVGPGPIGLLHVQALKASGCKVIVIGLDQDEGKFRVAEKMGADLIINGSRDNVADAVREFTKGRGADIVIETASSPKALNTAIEVIGSKGRLSSFGLYPEVTIRYLDILRKGVTIYGEVGMLGRHFVKGIKWVENGYITPELLITGRYKLEEVKQALAEVNGGSAIKVIFEL